MSSFSNYDSFKMQAFKKEREVIQKVTSELMYKKYFLDIGSLADKKCSNECGYTSFVDAEIVKNKNNTANNANIIKIDPKLEQCFDYCVAKMFNSSMEAIKTLDKIFDI